MVMDLPRRSPRVDSDMDDGQEKEAVTSDVEMQRAMVEAERG